jgi:imidazole glycerol phosphate synthase glutamine amidotransferase subunit
MITILNYGEGNITSVQKAFEYLGQDVLVSDKLDDIESAEALVIPGQGAFKQVMTTLTNKGFVEPIKAHIKAKKPFLGICLGFQVLFEGSDEHGGCEGLGIYEGRFKEFVPSDLKVPQMGWNQLQVSENTTMFEGMSKEAFVYFVHSFYLPSTDPTKVSSQTDYGLNYVSAIQDGPIWGTQFHPEKSGDVGLEILKNFCKLI